MGDYTPSTETVREIYGDHVAMDRFVVGQPFAPSDITDEFDRWLSEVRAAAWDEGAKWGAVEVTGNDRYETGAFLTPSDNPYRHDGFPPLLPNETT